MNSTTLTPQESLSLITKTIEDAKSRYQENGSIFIFWGILIFIASMGQFILLQLEYYKISYYPYFMMPLGGIYTGYYYYNKYKTKKLPKNILSYILSALGISLGANFTILGFFFWQELGSALFPVFSILLAIYVLISGIAIRFKPFVYSGILLNLAGICSFYIAMEFHPLIFALAGIFTFTVPGIILNTVNKRKNV